MKTNLLFPILRFCVLFGAAVPAIALDDVGSIAGNFTLVNRATGAPLRLHDYAGSVILLDYFAAWCPFCRAQSPQIEAQINEYYRDQGGTANGVPVTVITVNFYSGNPSYTDQLIAQFGLDLVADDFALTSYNQFGVSGQPYYVIINGLTNSTSHRPWEVLLRQSSYGGTTAPISTLRSVLESVKPGPPRLSEPQLSSGGGFEFLVPSRRGGTTRVEFSADFRSWTTLTNVSGTNGLVLVQDIHPFPGARFYRAVGE